jgi:hypothetical protein
MSNPIHNIELSLKGGPRIELWFDEKEEVGEWMVYRLRGLMVAKVRKADVVRVTVLFEEPGRAAEN